MTLLLQGIGFFIFLFVVYKFVALSPLADAGGEGRRRQIADAGSAEAEKACLARHCAERSRQAHRVEAKAKAADIVAQAEKQRNDDRRPKADAKAAGERGKADGCRRNRAAVGQGQRRAARPRG